MMTVSEFKAKLSEQISAEEESALRNGGLCINGFNRSVCLRLLDWECRDDSPVSLAEAEDLRGDLETYLNEYMQDKPEGHKWIILACLYLTFVEHIPMHPQHAAKWVEKDGRYYCPSMEPDSITCRYCMCERLYLAYGSNLNISQMQQRCHDARIVGTAELSGWRLMFKGSKRGYYLTIERSEGFVVPVAVWIVSGQDERNLDRYEGFPDFYYKKDLTVTMRDAESGISRSVKAFVYIMHEDRDLGRPTDSYVERCREGYKTFGFDTALLDEAYEFSCNALL